MLARQREPPCTRPHCCSNLSPTQHEASALHATMRNRRRRLDQRRYHQRKCELLAAVSSVPPPKCGMETITRQSWRRSHILTAAASRSRLNQCAIADTHVPSELLLTNVGRSEIPTRTPA